MTVDYVDGIKVMKLHDCHGAAAHADDTQTMLRLWQLLTGGHAMREASVFCRRG